MFERVDVVIGYRIKAINQKWYFEFIPTNNKNQPIGESKCYSSEKECKEAVKHFRDLIINKHIFSYDSPFIKIYKTDKGWYLEYILNNKSVFKSRNYTAKESCKKCISSIYKRLDDYTLNRIKEDF